jgi:hypothetical protein
MEGFDMSVGPQMEEAQFLGQMPQAPTQVFTILDFGARGWNPTHPDEQLVGKAGAPAAQFSIATAAPVSSPDMHDVDFWNGFLNKRNGKKSIANALGSAFMGIFVYAPLNGIKLLISFAASTINFMPFGNSAWSSLSYPFLTDIQYSVFLTMQNLLLFFPTTTPGNMPVMPMWWDGIMPSMGWLGNRLSPWYQAKLTGVPYYYINITGISSALLVSVAPNQLASGLYIGETIYLDNGNYMETNVVSNFTYNGTPGQINYYVNAIILQNPLKYPAQNYTRASWNAAQVIGLSTGGSIVTQASGNTVIVMAVTQLQSGGQRASFFSVDLPPTTGVASIQISGLNLAGGDGKIWGNDLTYEATTFFMTGLFNAELSPIQPGSAASQIFYLIPGNYLVPDGGTPQNPVPNGTTSITIQQIPDSTWTTAVGALGIDQQAALTGQIDVPFATNAVSWQGFIITSNNNSTLQISAYNAPHVWGTAGGMDGTSITVPDINDGQNIIGFYPYRGFLYIFKTNSTYLMTFNGSNSLSPFDIQKMQGNFGPISPGLIAETDEYVVFLSASGLCAISGMTVFVLQPTSDFIRAKFIGPKAWNLSAMGQAQSVVLPQKQQIWFQVAEGNTLDTILVYDWERHIFWYNTGGAAESYIASDMTSSTPALYGGDSNGQLWQLDIPEPDENPPIAFHWETPWLNFDDPVSWKTIKMLFIGGNKQPVVNGIHPTLNILLYHDFNPKAWKVITQDMSDPRFESGTWFPFNDRARYFKIALTNNQNNQPVGIRYLSLLYTNEGPDL